MSLSDNADDYSTEETSSEEEDQQENYEGIEVETERGREKVGQMEQLQDNRNQQQRKPRPGQRIKWAVLRWGDVESNRL